MFNRSIDEEDIGEIIEFVLGDVGLLVDIAAKPQIPPLVGPITISTVPQVSCIAIALDNIHTEH